MKMITLATGICLMVLIPAGAARAQTPVESDDDFEPVPLVNPQCPDGTYPDSYEAARAGTGPCVPEDPCTSSGTTLWTLVPCDPEPVIEVVATGPLQTSQGAVAVAAPPSLPSQAAQPQAAQLPSTGAEHVLMALAAGALVLSGTGLRRLARR